MWLVLRAASECPTQQPTASRAVEGVGGHAYALVRRESPAEMIQEEMEALRAMLDERRSSQLKKS